MSAPYFTDGRVTLYLGDCREVTDWLAADVLVTDPPYGIGYSTNWGGQFTGKPIAGDADESLRDSVLAMWGDRPAAVFASHKQRPYGEPNPLPLIFDKGDVVGMGNLSWPWRPSYELVWIYGTGWTGRRDPAVLRYRVLPGNFTARAPPGTIADPFAGSGSTLVAARNLGRQAIGVEIDERYCELAARRLAQADLFGDAA
jgi:hypothetical protein